MTTDVMIVKEGWLHKRGVFVRSAVREPAAVPSEMSLGLSVCFDWTASVPGGQSKRLLVDGDNTRSEFNTTVWNLTASVQEECECVSVDSSSSSLKNIQAI
ncbi:hypothetical protein QQF64_010626 [Cirrhinus molitorella]|uniref:Uncharacterized protein n=1 Tax=Cirrhinus molitorella TaxID=172907 RepID=A0ABR3M0G9_9TELE